MKIVEWVIIFSAEISVCNVGMHLFIIFEPLAFLSLFYIFTMASFLYPLILYLISGFGGYFLELSFILHLSYLSLKIVCIVICVLHVKRGFRIYIAYSDRKKITVKIKKPLFSEEADSLLRRPNCSQNGKTISKLLRNNH